jgi:hypothetical protein
MIFNNLPFKSCSFLEKTVYNIFNLFLQRKTLFFLKLSLGFLSQAVSSGPIAPKNAYNQ